jgi:uncharacterized protein (DUF697 family)
MTDQEQALRLADALEAFWGADLGHDRERQAAAELRRLHALNGELLEALKDVLRYVSPVADGAINARAAIAKAEGEKT